MLRQSELNNTQPQYLYPKAQLHTGPKQKIHSTRQSVLHDPIFMNNLNLTNTFTYYQKYPYTNTQIVYEDKQIIQKIPVEKTIIDYKKVRKTKMVPKQKIIQDHYTLESKITYVPYLVPETRIQYVPITVNTQRVQYYPFQKQIIHFDKSSKNMVRSKSVQLQHTNTQSNKNYTQIPFNTTSTSMYHKINPQASVYYSQTYPYNSVHTVRQRGVETSFDIKKRRQNESKINISVDRKRKYKIFELRSYSNSKTHKK